MSVCITLPSCTLLFSPIWISSLSPRSTAPNQTLAPLSRRTLPITAAVGAIQLSEWASTRCVTQAVLHGESSQTLMTRTDVGCRRLRQVDAGAEGDIDQFDDHHRRQAPDLVVVVVIAGHVPAAPLVVDAMGDLARGLQEEAQRHREHRGDLVVVGAVLDIVRHQADIGRDMDAEARHQRAERADDLHQAGRQAHLLLRLAQGGKGQVGVGGIATAAREGHFATVGGQAAGAQGQHQLRVVTAGQRHQHGRLRVLPVGLQDAWTVAAHALQELVEHDDSRFFRVLFFCPASWHEGAVRPIPQTRRAACRARPAAPTWATNQENAA